VGETLIYATETALLGRVGTTELAAISLIDTAIEIWIVPVVGLVEAMQIMVAPRGAWHHLVGGGPIERHHLLQGDLRQGVGARLRAPQDHHAAEGE